MQLKDSLVFFLIVYSQTCIKRSPFGQWKSGLSWQVTFLKRFNSYEIVYDRTRKKGPFNTSDVDLIYPIEDEMKDTTDRR
jgi:hypothetical protein